MSTANEETIGVIEKAYHRECQVCGEFRSMEVITTLKLDVSGRFGLEDLVYFEVDHCFDRRECKQQALKRAQDFAAGR